MEKDKIEVGEYIRTKEGIIGKLENINEFRPPENKYAVEINEELYFIGDKQLEGTKHSKNIIDLIEVGDYVNGAETVSEKYRYNNINFINVDSKISYGWGEGAIMESEIETIVTKEQFKEMEYRV